MGRACSTNGGGGESIHVPLGTIKRKWKDNIKMHGTESSYHPIGGINWIHLAQDRDQ
jgi:hypothetical protein